MTDLHAKGPVKDASISIVVHRADGTVQDYGTVSSMHMGRLQRLRTTVRIWRLNLAASRRRPRNFSGRN